jgi:hypothetical protein
MNAALAPSPRRPTHTRTITCEGFEREDGLLEIEGLLVDSRPTPLTMPTKSLAAGEAIHQMRAVMVIDRQRTILQLRVVTEHSPYPVCGDIAPSYEQLVGLRIEPGFTQAMKQLFRGPLGCSHITELLPRMAATVFQMLWADGPDMEGGQGGGKRMSPIGGCHALTRDGQVVRTYFPRLAGEPS